MNVKIVLEFTDEERQQAEDAFHGTDYRAALVSVREHILSTIKFREMSDEERGAWEAIRQDFYGITSHLNLDS